MPDRCPECGAYWDQGTCEACGHGHDSQPSCPRCGGTVETTGLLTADVTCTQCGRHFDHDEIAEA
jgi:predicted amidophosphoribosyltransferase